jgi:hypothetical protein
MSRRFQFSLWNLLGAMLWLSICAASFGVHSLGVLDWPKWLIVALAAPGYVVAALLLWSWAGFFRLTFPKARMIRYSLRDLLYWLTVWIVFASLLAAFSPSPVALIVMTAWFFGTVFVNKGFRPPGGLTYSIAFGFMLCAICLALASPTAVPGYYFYVFPVSFLFGLISGPIVWGIADAADEVCNEFIRGRSDSADI